MEDDSDYDSRDHRQNLEQAIAQLDASIDDLARARETEPFTPVWDLIESARQLLLLSGGAQAICQRSKKIEDAGFFAGSDWAEPQILQAELAARTLREAEPTLALIEAISQLRILAVAQEQYTHPQLSEAAAIEFLRQAMALNSDLLSGFMSEVDRLRPQGLGTVVLEVYRFQLDTLGHGVIVDSVVNEVWRLLAQRPLQVDGIKGMIARIAGSLSDPAMDPACTDKARRLVQAVFAPSPACAEDPGLGVYQQRLSAMGADSLAEEAQAFSNAMHETGLVSPYHPVLLRHVLHLPEDLLADTLGLGITGRDALSCYHALVVALIDRAVHPETPQALYGLSALLDGGVLYSRPVTLQLWQLLEITLCGNAAGVISNAYGSAHPPEVFLLAGVIGILGQPLGIGQGNNPTCQSARALSMWAFNDQDYLLELIDAAARNDEVCMHFEEKVLASSGLESGLAALPPLDVDPVSLMLVPHLDRIYFNMGRQCIGRNDDPHRWVNPEFHGWWVWPGFRIAVDVTSGTIPDPKGFLRDFYACYHPDYNGNRRVTHPQPAGIAITDNACRFLGWHAITLLRVALDDQDTMRVYFFNPNNDSEQDWGQGIHTSTRGFGEIPGEASLPIGELASRIYLFHYKPSQVGDPDNVPEHEIEAPLRLLRESWGAKRIS